MCRSSAHASRPSGRVAAGTLRAVDPQTAARALLGAVNWTVKWSRADGERTAGEIGEVLLGKAEGRTSSREITLFKSLGLAVEDLAALHLIYTTAHEQRVGTLVELGGGRHETA